MTQGKEKSAIAEEGSVTNWVAKIQEGDPQAAEKLWRRYFHRLVGLARQKLRDNPRRVVDEEDVALSAFDSFCRRAEAGKFPDLTDRDSLWRVLMTITVRKVSRQIRDQQRLKRGGPPSDNRQSEEIDPLELIGQEPGPDLVVAAAEEFQRLLEVLADEQLRSVALWKMEGYTTEEIATRLGCATRSVKRKTQLIRDLWKDNSQGNT